MTPQAPASPWMTAAEAAAYTHRSKRFLAREVRAGRLRAARVTGRGELVYRREWLDLFLEDLATPVVVSPVRRRA